MQDMDLYSRRNIKNSPPSFEAQDPEYFSRMTNTHQNEVERSRKKANRMMSLIIGLCIISFTLGLVVGIKFAGGSQNELVDKHTRKAVSDIGKKMTSLVNEDSAAAAETASDSNKGKNTFPKEEYPYIIRVGTEFDKVQAHDIANQLSKNGHTVILAKNNQNFKIYIGPFKLKKDAEISLKKISSSPDSKWAENTLILKR